VNVLEANWRMLRFNPLVFALSVGLQVFRLGLILAPGLVLRAVFDRLAVRTELDWTMWGLVALLVALPLARIAALLSGVFVEATAYFVSAALMRSNVFERLLRRPDLQRLPAPVGDIVNRLDKDAGNLSVLLSLEASTLGGSVGAIISFVLLLGIDPVIALVVTTPLLLVGGMSGVLGRNMMAYQRRSRRAEGQVSAFLGEAFGAVQALQIAGAERRAAERLRQLNRERRDATVAQRLYAFVLFDRFVSALSQLGLGLAVLLGGRALRDGSFTVGDFALMTYLIPQIADFAWYAGGVLVFLRQARISLDGLEPLLAGAEPQALLAPRAVPWHRIKTKHVPLAEPVEPLRLLSVRGLGYRYPNGAGVADIDLELPRGSFTVLTGRIGAGKTTVLRALLGSVPKDSGEIRWNGRAVDDPQSFFVPPRSAYTPPGAAFIQRNAAQQPRARPGTQRARAPNSGASCGAGARRLHAAAGAGYHHRPPRRQAERRAGAARCGGAHVRTQCRAAGLRRSVERTGCRNRAHGVGAPYGGGRSKVDGRKSGTVDRRPSTFDYFGCFPSPCRAAAGRPYRGAQGWPRRGRGQARLAAPAFGRDARAVVRRRRAAGRVTPGQKRSANIREYERILAGQKRKGAKRQRIRNTNPVAGTKN